MKIQSVQSCSFLYDNCLSVQEKYALFRIKWHKEIHDIHTLMVSIKNMLVFYVFAGIFFLLGTAIVISLVKEPGYTNEIQYIDYYGVVVSYLLSVFFYRGSQYWYSTCVEQEIYIGFCCDITPDFLQEYNMISAADVSTIIPSVSCLSRYIELRKKYLKH